MNRALAAIAARCVGRRVRLSCGREGTITRVTPAGFTVALAGLTREDVTFLDD